MLIKPEDPTVLPELTSEWHSTIRIAFTALLEGGARILDCRGHLIHYDIEKYSPAIGVPKKIAPWPAIEDFEDINLRYVIGPEFAIQEFDQDEAEEPTSWNQLPLITQLKD